MADIVPVNVVDTHKVYMDTVASDPLTVAKALPIAGLRHKAFFFSDADDNEVFKTPPGTVAVAFQANAVTNLTTVNIDSSGGILFDSAANSAGWLHCLCRGSLTSGTTTIDAPVAVGTGGYVHPDRHIFLNHKSATPDTASSGRRVSKLGLRLQIFQFETTADNDLWKATTLGLCPNIVAVAWQANTGAEDVVVTLNANGDVKFDSTAGSADYGWLWCWRRG